MIQVRKSADRGKAEHGWLQSRHSFSFAEYYDERQMGFGPLRVINEDWIRGGMGFGPHPHRDMEIITYIVEGALLHQDSMGNEAVIKPGEVQRMSAGTGVRHSEYNPLKDRTTHLLQIWIVPDKVGTMPSYGQKSFATELDRGQLILVASKSGRDGSVTLNRDVEVFVAKSKDAGEKVLTTSPGHHLWVQVVKGEVTIAAETQAGVGATGGAESHAAPGATTLLAGDGAGLNNIAELRLKWKSGAEFILFDMAS